MAHSSIGPTPVIQGQLQGLADDLADARADNHMLKRIQDGQHAAINKLRADLDEYAHALDHLEDLLCRWLHEHAQTCGCGLCLETRQIVEPEGEECGS